ncbi:MAG: flagellar motor switch protein FliM [Nitrospirae bacterium RBG_13_43_8]|nr:MAG: flagellar motor switch protein FliM [Nitrospirae bacterium RBG_13_43_8]
MNPILSQDEVNALLNGVQAGDIETENARKKALSDARPYDLTRQEHILQGQMPRFERINENFVKSFGNSVSNLIMRLVDVSIHNIETLTFGELMKIMPSLSSINIFKMEPLKGHALLILEAPLVFALVEFFFGGNGGQYTIAEEKSFTSIEQRVIKRVVAAALHDLSAAWHEILPTRPEHLGSEMNPQFVTIVTPGEILIRIEIHIKVEDVTGKLFLCIPYPMMEPLMNKLSAGIQTDKSDVDQKWIATLKKIIMDSPVEITAELGTAEITFGDLMNLEPGCLISLGKSLSDESIIKVEGIPRFRGMPGYSQGNQAIRITTIT